MLVLQNEHLGVNTNLRPPSDAGWPPRYPSQSAASPPLYQHTTSMSNRQMRRINIHATTQLAPVLAMEPSRITAHKPVLQCATQHACRRRLMYSCVPPSLLCGNESIIGMSERVALTYNSDPHTYIHRPLMTPAPFIFGKGSAEGFTEMLGNSYRSEPTFSTQLPVVLPPLVLHHAVKHSTKQSLHACHGHYSLLLHLPEQYEHNIRLSAGMFTDHFYISDCDWKLRETRHAITAYLSMAFMIFGSRSMRWSYSSRLHKFMETIGINTPNV